MSAPHIFVGCAGWSLPAKTADAFPAEGSHLQRYASVFNAVEINSSFYRPHRPATYARWRDSVPEHFRFSVKIPRSITHEKRLRDVEALLATFLGEAGELKQTLGCLLLQLPPSLKFSAEEAAAFFAMLRRQTALPVACEPRHASWFAPVAAELMQQFAVGCVRADPSPVGGLEPLGDARTFYIRLHGSPVIYRSAYDAAFLDALVTRIKAAHTAHRIWCVFDNTAEGAAMPNALDLLQRLRQ